MIPYNYYTILAYLRFHLDLHLHVFILYWHRYLLAMKNKEKKYLCYYMILHIYLVINHTSSLHPFNI